MMKKQMKRRTLQTPSDVPDLSDSEDSDDSDQDGATDDHNLGRYSPDQPENDDDEESDPELEAEHNDDNDPKNKLPSLISPGDSGFRNSSDSDSEGEPLI